MVMTFSSQHEWPATDPTHRYFVLWGVALADNFVNMALLIISFVDLYFKNTFFLRVLERNINPALIY